MPALWIAHVTVTDADAYGRDTEHALEIRLVRTQGLFGASPFGYVDGDPAQERRPPLPVEPELVRLPDT